MKINALGHVVVRVTDLARAETFYHGLLGLPICAHLEQDGLKMTFFSLGNHHDFAVAEVEGDAVSSKAPGLDHVAFCIGTTMDELRDAKAYLEAAGVTTHPVDHGVTRSVYVTDPDGNGVELYVDVDDAWREEPQLIAMAEPMELDAD